MDCTNDDLLHTYNKLSLSSSGTLGDFNKTIQSTCTLEDELQRFTPISKWKSSSSTLDTYDKCENSIETEILTIERVLNGLVSFRDYLVSFIVSEDPYFSLHPEEIKKLVRFGTVKKKRNIKEITEELYLRFNMIKEFYDKKNITAFYLNHTLDENDREIKSSLSVKSAEEFPIDSHVCIEANTIGDLFRSLGPFFDEGILPLLFNPSRASVSPFFTMQGVKNMYPVINILRSLNANTLTISSPQGVVVRHSGDYSVVKFNVTPEDLSGSPGIGCSSLLELERAIERLLSKPLGSKSSIKESSGIGSVIQKINADQPLINKNLQDGVALSSFHNETSKNSEESKQKEKNTALPCKQNNDLCLTKVVISSASKGGVIKPFKAVTESNKSCKTVKSNHLSNNSKYLSSVFTPEKQFKRNSVKSSLSAPITNLEPKKLSLSLHSRMPLTQCQQNISANKSNLSKTVRVQALTPKLVDINYNCSEKHRINRSSTNYISSSSSMRVPVLNYTCNDDSDYTGNNNEDRVIVCFTLHRSLLKRVD